ncbi:MULTISPECIES: calcium/sodium antiporter [unclassified Ruminococcus]|uniref:calcium/sodium antiporter n=1 Tax=unclassified Ruminococcus TaxID=2608920 RepID=UPI00210EC37D|nr:MULTISPECIES: calcium/sodium antiporter [unclassified Ruminococcus]MCQ4021676.1 calcium/sodium antiporter [Ruminococcus sp. zg-924]MCQ4114121.1 calcium/sodium antiporter [Ruminococcus sp. zg-921]
MEIVFQIFLLIVGFAMLIKGADWFVDGASGIADKLGIPQIVIGLTIVAMGTSAPEAAISISAAVKGSADIAVGNVLGSNILNVLLILGITAVITPIAVQKSTIKYEIPFVILISILFGILGLTDNFIGRIDGIILLALFIAYLAYLFFMAKKGKHESEQEKPKESTLKLIIFALIGVALIIFGSNITVDAATSLAKIFGMSERLIGLTIVAFGTSLPELVTSVTAGIKKKADIAVGNIVGSNIFNILFVIGISSLITPVAYQSNFLIDSIVCVATSALLLVCVLNKSKKLKRWGGIIMLAAYAGYFVYLLCV